MNNLLHNLGKVLGIGCILFGLALPTLGAPANGDIVSVGASCEYMTGLNLKSTWISGATDIALATPLLNKPVYLAQGWERNKSLAVGMTVRALVRKDGQVVLANGVQLSDGRVMVDGQPLDRVY